MQFKFIAIPQLKDSGRCSEPAFSPFPQGIRSYHAEPSEWGDWHYFIYTLIIWKQYLQKKDNSCLGIRNKTIVCFIHFLVFTVILLNTLPCEACLVSIKLLYSHSWKNLIKSRLILLTARFHNSGVFHFDTKRYRARFIQRLLYVYKSVSGKNSIHLYRSII